MMTDNWDCPSDYATISKKLGEAITERDRLTAENTTLTATLDNLREVVPEGNKIYTWSEIRTLQAIVAARKILYPTPNGDER